MIFDAATLGRQGDQFTQADTWGLRSVEVHEQAGSAPARPAPMRAGSWIRC
jgi:hypothetical protein